MALLATSLHKKSGGHEVRFDILPFKKAVKIFILTAFFFYQGRWAEAASRSPTASFLFLVNVSSKTHHLNIDNLGGVIYGIDNADIADP